jgi:hypothetical protein
VNNSFSENFKKQTQKEISQLNYRKYFYQFSETEKIELVKGMKDIEIYFKQIMGLDVYPIYGTLLGMIRDNDLIGHDTDIDMAYLSKCHTKETVIKEFEEICKLLEKDTLLMYRIKTISHLHVYSPSKTLRIDLWISWIDLEGKYHLVWTIAGIEDASIILPFKTIEFKNQTLNLINDPERFLSGQYIDWKNPISGSEVGWLKRKPVFELQPWQGK